MLKIISDIEAKQEPRVTLLDAIRMIDRSWNEVSQECLANCYKKTGFEINDTPQMMPDVMSVSDDQWTAVNNALNVNEPSTFEDFVDIDVGAAVTGLLTDDEIIENIIVLDNLTNR
ncbi:hypothetical protein QAD02_021121 [Eretmocerus hayati]|uniref:Uncharacterized protein n=1 Tax=Eretmocerus hayati TaxID=131215 RepID=A0ACC2PPE1_9HYME|nr:hypothetical protein QAD02_021121 [Eretmocerus hayati]